MLRVAVTDVDSFRYWRNESDGDLSNLRDRLLHLEPPTESMEVGRLVHDALERAKAGDAVSLIEGAGLKVRVECEIDVPLMPVRECAITKVMEVPGFGLVQLSGRVDASDLVSVTDYKTTGRFDPERLHDAMQWRLYLWMTGARKFVWHVFEIRDPLVAEPDTYRLASVHLVEQWRYPFMEADCMWALQEFCDAVSAHVPEYVERRQAA